MKLDLNNIVLDRHDLDVLHDVIYNAYYDLFNIEKDLSDQEILDYWKLIPDDIKIDVVKYGMSDTPTRDRIYDIIQKQAKYNK